MSLAELEAMLDAIAWPWNEALSLLVDQVVVDDQVVLEEARGAR